MLAAQKAACFMVKLLANCHLNYCLNDGAALSWFYSGTIVCFVQTRFQASVSGLVSQVVIMSVVNCSDVVTFWSASPVAILSIPSLLSLLSTD